MDNIRLWERRKPLQKLIMFPYELQKLSSALIHRIKTVLENMKRKVCEVPHPVIKLRPLVEPLFVNPSCFQRITNKTRTLRMLDWRKVLAIRSALTPHDKSLLRPIVQDVPGNPLNMAAAPARSNNWFQALQIICHQSLMTSPGVYESLTFAFLFFASSLIFDDEWKNSNVSNEGGIGVFLNGEVAGGWGFFNTDWRDDPAFTRGTWTTLSWRECKSTLRYSYIYWRTN